jgi:hypothetical protein
VIYACHKIISTKCVKGDKVYMKCDEPGAEFCNTERKKERERKTDYAD